MNPLTTFKTIAWAALCATTLVACGGSDSSSTEPSFAAIELNIAHINDHHSQLEPFALQELILNGVATQVDLGGFSRQTALFKKAETEKKNLLKIHAGDAVTGTLYYTFYKGEVDAKMMNTICFDAFELGNHEFDDGDAVLANFLDTLITGPCKTPVLAANVTPKLGTALAPRTVNDYLQPYTSRPSRASRWR